MRQAVLSVTVRLWTGGTRQGEAEKPKNCIGALGCKACAFGKITGFVLSTFCQQKEHSVCPEAIQLVYGAENCEPLSSVLIAANADALHQAVEHLSIAHFDDVFAPEPQRLHGVGGEHADLGVGGDVVRPNRVSIELGELAETAGSRLLVAPHGADCVAPEGQGELLFLQSLRHVAGERCGEVVAQRQPLLVLVLEREHTLVGPVLVGQELAERIGVLDGRRLQRLETIALVHLPDRVQHALRRADVLRRRVEKAFGQPSLRPGVLVRLGHVRESRLIWRRL